MVAKPGSKACSVLVVEDDNDVRESIRLVLENEGFLTLAAADGAHGLALLSSERPDVVLLDMHLPIISGSEFLKRKAQTTAVSGVPVIAITGHPSSPQPDGTAAVLRKPFALDEFLGALRELTKR